MRIELRVLPVLVGLVFGLGVAVSGYTVTRFAPRAEAAAPAVNACGCYKNAAGACLCGKKGKCDCPGDCEPKGCEEKRAKELEKEMEAETKRAREAEKKQRDEAAEKERKAAAAEGLEPAAESQADKDDKADKADKTDKADKGDESGDVGDSSAAKKTKKGRRDKKK